MKVGDFCKTGAGGTPLKSNRSFYEGGNIPWLLSGEVGNRDITETKKFITQEGLDGSSAKMFPVNTVLIAMYGATAGEVGILRCEASTNQAVCGILPNEKVLPEYLYYFFLNHKDLLIAQAVGNAQPNISQLKIKNTEIPLPPIPEQKRIVALLDTVFFDLEQTCAKTEQNLKNSRELFDSYLQQVFSQKGEGWVEKTLGETVVVERGSSPRPIKNFQTTDEDGVNWIKIGDTKGITKYITSTKEKITPAGAEKSRKVNEGDFILSNSMSFGKPYIMATSGYIHDGWFVFRLPEYIDTEFFYYLLSSPFVQKQFQTLSSGAIVKNISGDLVKKAHLPIPPLAEQKIIADKLIDTSKEIEKLEIIYKQKLNSIDELKKSILQKAFSGELTTTAK